ncbi:hypothetical protein NIES2109_40950 [Nostoc sp. HK-01]|uniref:Uncharacterized protein n=1 Tax=Nostoc cycadae WK-1 TaxID=1861711 RepID=A0A2H6LGA7_9NOSO|nr:hypothetical protein [Nostoc cycadae]BBD61267.1 hypothetical protein NIES2109_40950 [Nostoc sp. HK-01]GBE92251.1 hypothetical protein NCWK1_2005 [Nostoc cycadae WK-1]
MNYQKLGAALAMALNDVQDPATPSLTVFIHTEPISEAAIAILQSFDVSDVTSDKDTFTATLSANAISQLSEQTWVKSLQLSQKLGLLNNGKRMQSFKI